MKVLYATDGRAAANNAGTLLEELGQRDDVQIAVLTVVQTDIYVLDGAGLLLASLPERRDTARRAMESAREGLTGAGFSTEGLIRDGHPGEEIVRLAEEGGFDLIVMGGGSHSWLGNALLGSASTHVLHRSPTSVMIVHELVRTTDPVRVLYGADGSAGAEIALDSLLELVDPRRCEVKVISVIPPPPLGPIPIPHEATYLEAVSKEMEREAEAARTCAERNVEDAVGRLQRVGFNATGATIKGYPSEQLLKEAEGGSFDLVVVGSRGLGPMRRAFLGSVSDHVARLSRAALVGRRTT